MTLSPEITSALAKQTLQQVQKDAREAALQEAIDEIAKMAQPGVTGIRGLQMASGVVRTLQMRGRS